MKHPFGSTWILVIVILLLSVQYFTDIGQIPFHPDESTNIYMSSDLEILLTHPKDLFWRPENKNDLRQVYRERDAPLTRYLIGIGRLITGENYLPIDWDWSKSWQDNQLSGSLPNPRLLLICRLSVACLFPLTLLLAFSIGNILQSRRLGWILLLSLASNALVLLHTRRAMAESALLFTVCLVLWIVLRFPQRPVWIGIAVALAFCAKQSTVGLIILGMAALLSSFTHNEVKFNVRCRQLLLFGGVFLLTIFLMNPFLWNNPIQAFSSAVQSRQELIREQSSVQNKYLPEQILSTPFQRLTGMLVQVYITPPAIAEVGNYLALTSESELIYSANPINHLFRGFIGGGILLFMGISGFCVALFFIIRNVPSNRNGYTLMILGTLIQSLILLLLVPFPWQRYYIPLIPFSCLWSSFFLDRLIEKIKECYNARFVKPLMMR
jgi:hypothetical protein